MKPRSLGTIGDGAKLKALGPKSRETFASALKRINAERGTARADLGKICRVSAAVVKSWEDGTAVPTKAEFGRLMKRHRRIRFFPPAEFSLVLETAAVDEETMDVGELEPLQLPAKAVTPRTFGASLRLERETEGLTQAELAEALEVSQTEVGLWETDKRDPPIETAKLLVDLFPRLLYGPYPKNVEKYAKAHGVAPKETSSDRIDSVRAVARLFLDNSTTPEQRQQRLEALREELPRRDRRALGIPSPDAEPLPKPAREVKSAVRKCPRCSEEVADLAAHREACANRQPREWENAGWRSCEKSLHPHHWNIHGPAQALHPPAEMVLRSSPCEAHRPVHEVKARPKNTQWVLAAAPPLVEALESPVPSGAQGGPMESQENTAPNVGSIPAPVPSAPDSGAPRPAADGLDLVERCLVLVDMLWPGEPHSFVLGARDAGWCASIVWQEVDGSLSFQERGYGEGKDKTAAVRALADALREETKVRAKAAAEMARLLED